MIKDLPNILHGFFEEAILSEETILKWYEHVCKTADAKGTDPKEKTFATALKDSSTSYIEWIK